MHYFRRITFAIDPQSFPTEIASIGGALAELDRLVLSVVDESGR